MGFVLGAVVRCLAQGTKPWRALKCMEHKLRRPTCCQQNWQACKKEAPWAAKSCSCWMNQPPHESSSLSWSTRSQSAGKFSHLRWSLEEEPTLRLCPKTAVLCQIKSILEQFCGVWYCGHTQLVEGSEKPEIKRCVGKGSPNTGNVCYLRKVVATPLAAGHKTLSRTLRQVTPSQATDASAVVSPTRNVQE